MDVQALMCTNKKWSQLPADEMNCLARIRIVHPTAQLIKELKFRAMPDRLYLLAPNGVRFRQFRRGWSMARQFLHSNLT